MNRRILAVGAAVALCVPAGLALSAPVSASVNNVVITPNTAAPGATVLVQAFFGATGWTSSSGEVQVVLSVPAGTPATFALGSNPGWATGPCGVSATSVVCGWQPFDESSEVRLDANLTVGPSAPAGSIAVTAVSQIAGVSPDASETAPLLVTLTPTSSPTSTPTPTGTAVPTPTGSATPSSTTAPGSSGSVAAGAAGADGVLPTAVPAGQEAQSGSPATGWLLAGTLLLIGGAGGAAMIARKRRGQYQA